MKNKKKYYTLIESEVQIPHLLSYINNNSILIDDISFYTLSPNVFATMKRKGLNVINSNEFFKSQDHITASKKVFNKIKSLNLKINSIGITFIYYYQWILGYIILLEESLANIIKMRDKSDILLCPKKNIVNCTSPNISSNESYLKMISEKMNVINIMYYTQDTQKYDDSNSSTLIKNISSFLTMGNISIIKKSKKDIFFLETYKKGLDKILSSHAPNNNRNYVYLRGITSSINTKNSVLLKNIVFSLCSILDLTFGTRIISSLLKSDVSSVLNVSDIKPPTKTKLNFKLSLEDIFEDNIYELALEQKIKNGLFDILKCVEYRYSFFDLLFRNPNIEGVVAIEAVGDMAYFGELSNKYKKKGIIISHGSHPPPTDEISKLQYYFHSKALIDTSYPFCAVQSPLAEDFLKNSTNNKSKLIKTGPLIWGQKVPNKNLPSNGKFKIIHAGTQKAIHNLRYYIYESSDEYISELNKLISAIKDVPNCEFIIKFRPSKDLSLETLKFLLIDGNYKIETNINFSCLLNSADVVISYSSTTIEEAIESNVPVILYGGRNRFRFIPDYKLERNPLFWCHSKEDLLNSIENIKNNNDWNWEKYSYKERETLTF